jgi:MFS family permease
MDVYCEVYMHNLYLSVETYGAFSINEGASYMCGRAVSSTVWGIVADKYGRKPVIVLTLIAM